MNAARLAALVCDAINARDAGLVAAACTAEAWAPAGDSVMALAERATRAGGALSVAGEALIAGDRAAVPVVRGAEDGSAELAFLLIDRTPPRAAGATLHEGVVGLFLAGHLPGTVDWSALPECPRAALWGEGLTRGADAGLPGGLGALLAGAEIAVEKALRLGTAPRSAVCLRLRLPGGAEAVRWVLLDHTAAGLAPVGEGPTLPVGALTAGWAPAPLRAEVPAQDLRFAEALSAAAASFLARHQQPDGAPPVVDEAFLQAHGAELLAAALSAVGSAAVPSQVDVPGAGAVPVAVDIGQVFQAMLPPAHRGRA